MFINNMKFNVDLEGINKIRYALYANIYSNPYYIDSLKRSIMHHISCTSIDFDVCQYMFIIKFKKTDMKKLTKKNFSQDPNFYYELVSKIFYEFIMENKEAIKLATSSLDITYDTNNIIDNIDSMIFSLSNLAHISFLADNVMCMRL